MAKYIIDVKDGETLYKAVIAPDGEPYITPAMGNVYTEPDLEHVREEAYEKGWKEAEDHYEKGYNDGYDTGLSHAWEAARKIIYEIDCEDRMKIFGGVNLNYIFALSPTTVIEKIRQYEQVKKEIKVGDEIKSGNERYVVLQKYLNNIDELMAVLFNRRDGDISVFHLYNGNGAIFEKTGRHFPEIAEILQKMREG